MTPTSRLSYVLFALALVAGIAGCSATASGAKASDVVSFAGHWHSPQWGEHYIVADGNTAKIIYEHLDGRVVATVDRSTLTGWCGIVEESATAAVQNVFEVGFERAHRHSIVGSARVGSTRSGAPPHRLADHFSAEQPQTQRPEEPLTDVS